MSLFVIVNYMLMLMLMGWQNISAIQIWNTGNELVGGILSSNVNWFWETYTALQFSSKESVVYLSSIASRSLFMAIWLLFSATFKQLILLWRSWSSFWIRADSAYMLKFWEVSLWVWSLGFGRGLIGIIGGLIRCDIDTLSMPSCI